MINKLKSTIGWTKIFIAFALLASAFSFSAAAQTNTGKPMSAGALAALVEELKGVVGNSGASEQETALVADRWNKRKDLSGKSKKEVISLLYDDVKAVIKDSGTQYQIGSIFSTYKQMPDESPNPDTQKPQSASSKAELVSKLIELTAKAHPTVSAGEQMALIPKTKEEEEAEKAGKDDQMDAFDEALKQNKQLTPKQKDFVADNYEELGEMIDKQITDLEKARLPVEKWVRESLQKSYAAKLTDAELTNLIAFFQSSNGSKVLNYVRSSETSEESVKRGGKPFYTPQDEAEAQKFAKTPLGEKFADTFLKDINEYVGLKSASALGGYQEPPSLTVMAPENLNKIFNQFVKDNYKK